MSKSINRTQKSRQWIKRHIDDNYVRQAIKSSYRSRAVFKLQEIDQRNRLINAGMRIIDLGAAPGSWSQYAAQRVRGKGRVIAIDLLPIQALEDVRVIQGDFCDSKSQSLILEFLDGQAADTILSDMAPNITGISITDQANMEILLNGIVKSCDRLLKPGGSLLVKVFEGQIVADFRKSLKLLFNKVSTIKPDASRKHSREIYLLARNFRKFA